MRSSRRSQAQCSGRSYQGWLQRTARPGHGTGALDNPEVQLTIHEKEIVALEAADVDAAYVIMGIRDVIERCRGSGKAFNPVSALRGFELLGRYLKLWTDKVELNDVGNS